MDVHSKVAQQISEVKANISYFEELSESDDGVEALSAELMVDAFREDLRELLDTWNVITR